MADDRHGRWAPLTIDAARHELDGCPARWWISGGHALERFVGHSWRAHDDLDVGIRRCDAGLVLTHLRDRGWEVVVAAAGVLNPWDGGPLDEAALQNNVWCRRAGGPWAFDVTVGEGDDDAWVYRRDPTLRRPWDEAVLHRDGVRFLAPELQLLFKSTNVRPKDTVDAQVVIPRLDAPRRAFLHDRLPDDHPWRSLLPPRR